MNIAPAQLGADGFLGTVTELVDTHRLRPGQLVLEITESGLAADLTGTQSVLAELRRAGIAISLDAFGVGYSSLSRLGELELDSVKIERSFLDRIDADPRREALVHGLPGWPPTSRCRSSPKGWSSPASWPPWNASAAPTARATYSAAPPSPPPPPPASGLTRSTIMV